ncbi:CPBP family intramembrane glutamic endopeptidase [Clostridium sp. B9]|uniref:CPBP family intramembrane glutamic endopeptidase n=1 Tax=Clostridium sp. B9 TaxID=3423224 RepID=UPI003D2EDEF2
MTLEKINLKELIKSILFLFLILIKAEILSALISVPFYLIGDQVLVQRFGLSNIDTLLEMFYSCLTQVLSIFFFYKIYKNKGFNLIKSKENLNLKTLGEFSIITIGAIIFDYLWISLVTFLSTYSSFFKNNLIELNNSMSILDENFLFALISAVILAPLMEELIFRGIIFNEAEKYKKGAFPIIVSAILFGLLHINPLHIVAASFSGIILGIVYSKTRSLKITIFMHALNNLLSCFPESFDTAILILSVICFIPMIYFLIKLYKPKNTSKVQSSTTL